MDLKRKAIRVGLSASLCFLVSDLLNLKFPFFALLPAVMPISTFFGETIKFGINRIVGSTIGAVIGILFASIKPTNLLLVGLGVAVIIYVCSYLKWDSTTSIACLVFASIIVGVKEPSAFEYSIHRLIATFIGIAITTIVNNYVFNPDMSKLLKKQAAKIQNNLLDIANNKNFLVSKEDLDNLEFELHDIKDKFRIYSEELKLNSRHSDTKIKLDNLTDILVFTFEQIKIINYINMNKNNDASNSIKANSENIDAVMKFHKDIFNNEIANLKVIINELP